MLRQFTFLCTCDGGGNWSVVAAKLGRLYYTDTFDVNLLGFPQLATVVALSDWSSFLLDLVQGAVGVLAVRRAVALDA